jgi:hypothetical protein
MVWSGPAIAKMSDRLVKWKEIFDEHNLKFDKKYWSMGSNYKRDYKVFRALGVARKEQVEDNNLN